MTAPLAERLARAREALAASTHLLLGGGAGLSDAAGIKYAGPSFQAAFAPFIARYRMTDMYSAGFHPFATEEERWGYWARHITVARYQPPALPLYLQLRRLAEGRRAFVLTTNVDHQFFKAGFPAEQVFAVQGDYGLDQCERGCHPVLYANQARVAAMVAATVDCRIPTALVPCCPVCGGPMAPNLRKDEHFVEDEAWDAAAERYRAFVAEALPAQPVLLELGVGFNTPGLIRHPFERMLRSAPRATLLRLNLHHPEGPPGTLSFPEPMEEVLAALLAPA